MPPKMMAYRVWGTRDAEGLNVKLRRSSDSETTPATGAELLPFVSRKFTITVTGLNRSVDCTEMATSVGIPVVSLVGLIERVGDVRSAPVAVVKVTLTGVVRAFPLRSLIAEMFNV